MYPASREQTPIFGSIQSIVFFIIFTWDIKFFIVCSNLFFDDVIIFLKGLAMVII